MFKEITIQDFCEQVGAKTPAPGGGTVSALAAALSQSLLLMVNRLSIIDEKPPFQELLTLLIQLGDISFRLMDEDTQAFKGVMEAYRLPKGEEEVRKRAIQDAYTSAIQAPLQVMEVACQLLEKALLLVREGNEKALSDSGVGALLAGTALKGARYNVLINLPAINDREKGKEYRKRMDHLYQQGSKDLTLLEELLEEALSVEEG